MTPAPVRPGVVEALAHLVIASGAVDEIVECQDFVHGDVEENSWSVDACQEAIGRVELATSDELRAAIQRAKEMEKNRGE